MKITILNISDSDKHFDGAIKEYLKRFGNEVNIINIRPEKSGEKGKIIKKDTEKVISSIEKNKDYKILLSIGGTKYDSLGFAEIIKKNGNICFIIGGAYGLDEDILGKYVDLKISFSDMTFPHGLSKLILLEQIFRSQMILSNRDYHY